MPMKISKELSLKLLIATLVIATLNLHQLDAMFIKGIRNLQKSRTYRPNSTSFTHSPRFENGAKYLALGIAASASWWLMQENVDADDNDELENNSNQKIVMRIFLWHKTSIGANVYAGLLTFEGFGAGQVLLISGDKTPTFLCRFIHHDKTYTPNDFENILNNDPTCPYPSQFHKKLNYLSDDAHLTILRYDKEDPMEVDLSPEVKDRLLKYLLHDLEDQDRDCYDFFREILFEQPEANNEIFVSPIDELDLNPGDGVILFDFSKKPDDARHFAIALGDRLYLSRFGRGRPIFVTDMKSMMEVYKCPVFGKANPSIIEPKKTEPKKSDFQDTHQTSGCTIF